MYSASAPRLRSSGNLALGRLRNRRGLLFYTLGGPLSYVTDRTIASMRAWCIPYKVQDRFTPLATAWTAGTRSGRARTAGEVGPIAEYYKEAAPRLGPGDAYRIGPGPGGRERKPWIREGERQPDPAGHCNKRATRGMEGNPSSAAPEPSMIAHERGPEPDRHQPRPGRNGSRRKAGAP